jgi:orotidine-5'-phosphate decarboxylase
VRDSGKGLYLLVRTSNPSAPELQDARLSDQRLVYEHVADLVATWGRRAVGDSGYSSLGMVVGATYPHELSALKQRHPKTPFLVPGFGAQGGTSESIAGAFEADAFDFLVASSREILKAAAASELPRTECIAALRAAAESMRDDLLAALSRESGRRAP